MNSEATPIKRKRFLVTPHRPWRTLLVLAIIALVGSIAGWRLFEAGRVRAGFDRQAAFNRQIELLKTIDDFEARNARLVTENAVLARSSRIDKQAAAEVKQAIADLQLQMLEQREELAFYRSLVSPSERESGLHIRSVLLEPMETAGAYGYDFVLTQVRQNDTFAVGKLDLRITGSVNGASKSLSLTQVSAAESDAVKFKFKYFQNVNGALKLPAEFEPKSLEINLLPSGKRLKKVSQSYAWQTVLSGGN